MRDPSAAKIGEFLRVGLGGSFSERDDRVDALAPFTIGHADDRHLSDRGMPAKCIFDFDRLKILNHQHNHVLNRS